MPAMTAAELAALAELNVQTSKNLDRISKNLHDLIAAEGKKIGDERGVQYAKTAKEQITEIEKAAAVEIQRRDDVIEELRRQLEVQASLAQEGREAKARLTAVQLVKVWRDDLGRGYVFVDELAHAVDPDTYPAPQPARIES